jgi:glycosyltransferase involved in cell wall biosynthesis
MIATTLAGSYRDVSLTHVRMAFSRRLAETEGFAARKVLHAIAVIARVALARVRTGADVLYYPPSDGEGLPLYRDMVILGATRWMFRCTVLHFHAGGVSGAQHRLPRWARPLFRRAFFGADVGIRTSPGAPDDPARLGARREFVVANGVEDVAGDLPPAVLEQRRRQVPHVLFVGLLRESKGLFVLLEACAELAQRGLRFVVDLVGEFHSDAVRAATDEYVARHGLGTVVRYRGVLVGNDKAAAYERANVLAFPTFFQSETFGLVLIEAMQFALPVVATAWRGIPSVVDDGATGYLVPVGDHLALAQRLSELLSDHDAAERLGRAGRARYEREYTLARFHTGMQRVFDSLLGDVAA